MTNINIAISSELHKKLRIISATEDTTIKSLVINYLEEYVKEEKK